MKTASIRLPVPPAMLFTLLLVFLMLYMAYLIAPHTMRLALVVCAGLMAVLVALSSVELTLYLLIFSTLLSPELQLGGIAEPTAAVGRGVTIRLDDLLLGIITLTWLFRMAVFKNLGLVRRTPMNQPIFWYMFATVVATTIGALAGRVGIFGFFFVLKYFEYFLLYIMVVNQVHDNESIRRYIGIMVFTCFIVAVLGLAQIPGGERVTAPFEGNIGEPNTLGGYLVLLAGLVLGLFLYEANQIRRWRQAGLLLMIIITLAYTESRSSYVAFVVMIGLFILLSERKVILILGSLLVLALSPFVFPQTVVDRVTYTFTQQAQPGQISVGGAHIDTSTSERLHAWENVFTKYFPQHPLFGVGVTGGGFLDAMYPRVLYETGIFGLLFFLWLLQRMWLLLFGCYRELSDPRLKGAAIGTLCGFGGLLFHAIGSNTFIIVRIMEPLMILLGLILSALLVQREEEQDEKSVTAVG